MTEKIEGGFDRDGVGLDLQQLIGWLELLVDAARGLDVTLSERPDHLLDLGPDDVSVDTDTPESTQLEERENEVVVPRVEVEVGLTDDAPRLDEVVVRLFDRPDRRDLGQLDDGVGLDVDDDAGRDVVGDDRLVADVGDRPEVFDDPAGRRLVVVRGDDEETVYTELVRFTRKVDRVGGGVGPGAGDDGAPPAERVDGDPEELEPLVVAESGALPGRPRDDEPIRTTLDEILREFAEALEVDRSVTPEGRDDRG